MSVLTPGCNCASHGLVEEYRHGSMCPYGVELRRQASEGARQRAREMREEAERRCGGRLPSDDREAVDSVLADIVEQAAEGRSD